ncbi:flagellar biosynthetic protein FliR [Liquorilactobacillus sicerae]|uniref:flagellar biosynthetic protein FliR n=1 Tax=Liquorilactobacillus sicerae TaxID=1416943 RepID=UPI0024810970|nr:flagellar biosynthetic protein FliR [Liquorilactobacillus sicerae]
MISNGQIQVVALLLCRIMSFIAAAPVFSQKDFPNLAKIILGFGIIVSVYPQIDNYHVITSLIAFLLIVVKEILVGLAMGYIGQLVFNAISIAGQMIDFQVGFSMAQAYDSTFQVMSSQYGKMYYWLAVALFFMMNLHQQLIIGVIKSFKIIPLTGGMADGATIQGVVRLFCRTFIMAIELAAPLVITMLIVNLLLGIISRSVPQLNVLMLSLSLQAGLSFLIVLIMLPNIVDTLQQVLPHSVTNMEEFVRALK